MCLSPGCRGMYAGAMQACHQAPAAPQPLQHVYPQHGPQRPQHHGYGFYNSTDSSNLPRNTLDGNSNITSHSTYSYPYDGFKYSSQEFQGNPETCDIASRNYRRDGSQDRLTHGCVNDRQTQGCGDVLASEYYVHRSKSGVRDGRTDIHCDKSAQDYVRDGKSRTNRLTPESCQVAHRDYLDTDEGNSGTDRETDLNGRQQPQVWQWRCNMQHAGGAVVTQAPPALSAQYQDGSINMATPIVASMGGQHGQAQVQEAHSTTDQTHSTHLVQDADIAIEADKRAIYRHPLFPLMALLFEKCEQATQTPDCPSSDSFDMDIQAFVHHQEQDRKPFFSEDPELDNLMMKAIQVLRIHLLELEKVTDLCKDFCSRYISCLKGKLQSENLLRTDGMPGFECNSPPPPFSPTEGGVQGMVVQPAVPQQNNNGQAQIVSGGTVYQMVQTPQGLVAQPVQQISQAQPVPSQQSQPTQQAQAPTVIHGSTPLSQIGVPTSPSQTGTPTQQTGGLNPLLLNSAMFDDDDFLGKKNKNKRGVLPKQATQVMKSWLFQHIVHPYPTEDEKRQIAHQTNLTLLQVNNWFINARRRILQPMLDASTPAESKVKKTKPQSRPVQRFWPDNIANMQSQMTAGGSPTTPSSTSPGPDDIAEPHIMLSAATAERMSEELDQVTASSINGEHSQHSEISLENSEASSMEG